MVTVRCHVYTRLRYHGSAVDYCWFPVGYGSHVHIYLHTVHAHHRLTHPHLPLPGCCLLPHYTRVYTHLRFGSAHFRHTPRLRCYARTYRTLPARVYFTATCPVPHATVTPLPVHAAPRYLPLLRFRLVRYVGWLRLHTLRLPVTFVRYPGYVLVGWLHTHCVTCHLPALVVTVYGSVRWVLTGCGSFTAFRLRMVTGYRTHGYAAVGSLPRTPATRFGLPVHVYALPPVTAHVHVAVTDYRYRTCVAARFVQVTHTHRATRSAVGYTHAVYTPLPIAVVVHRTPLLPRLPRLHILRLPAHLLRFTHMVLLPAFTHTCSSPLVPAWITHTHRAAYTLRTTVTDARATTHCRFTLVISCLLRFPGYTLPHVLRLVHFVG